MITPDIESILRKTLAQSRSAVGQKLLAIPPEQLVKDEIATLERELLEQAPTEVNLEELLEAVRLIAASAGTEQEVLAKASIAVTVPRPANPFGFGIMNPERILSEAMSWLNDAQSAAAETSNAYVALLVQRALITAIIEYRILSPDYIPAIVCSLHDDRYISLHPQVAVIPLSLHYGNQANAEQRLLVVRAKSRQCFEQIRKHPGHKVFLGRLLQCVQRTKRSKQAALILDLLIQDAGSSLSRPAPPIADLLTAAQVLAHLHLPPAVVAHRTRKLVSHGLPPEALTRILGHKVKPFDPEYAGSDTDQDPELAAPVIPSDEPEWMVMFRTALRDTGPEHTKLDQLLSSGEPLAKLMADFAYYLEKSLSAPRAHSKSPSSGATIRRYCLLIASRVGPRLRNTAQESVSADFWEEILEQVLDEDVALRYQRYAESPRTNLQPYSRPLVKVLRHWLQFLDRRRTDRATKNPDEASEPSDAQEYARLIKRLPILGLLQVDACLITVDEFEKVVTRLVASPYNNDPKVRLRLRAALTLGYWCGLRYAEAAFLRVSDFDDIDYLHVRPNPLRTLKTSNARRDIPLRVLVPSQHLRYLQKLVILVRTVASNQQIPWDKAYLFSAAENPRKPAGFSWAAGKIEHAFRGYSEREWGPIDAGYHFHRLRHACANLLLLRLWPELHAFAQQALKNHPRTLQLLEKHQVFREQLFGFTQLERADLQAIALLLGHGSSATTLEHYLHVVDWCEAMQG